MCVNDRHEELKIGVRLSDPFGLIHLFQLRNLQNLDLEFQKWNLNPDEAKASLAPIAHLTSLNKLRLGFPGANALTEDWKIGAAIENLTALCEFSVLGWREGEEELHALSLKKDVALFPRSLTSVQMDETVDVLDDVQDSEDEVGWRVLLNMPLVCLQIGMPLSSQKTNDLFSIAPG